MILALLGWLSTGVPAAVAFARHGRPLLGLALLPFVGWLSLTVPWIASGLTGLVVRDAWWPALVVGLVIGGVCELVLRQTPGHEVELPPLGDLGARWVGLAALVLFAVINIGAGAKLQQGDPHFLWDGVVIWLTRTNAMATGTGPLFGDIVTPAVEKAHWDYPVLLPAWFAWLMNAAGLQLKELTLAIGLLAGLVPLCGGAVALRRLNPLLCTAILLLPFGLFKLWWRTFGAEADGPLALVSTVALVWLLIAVRDDDRPLLTGAGILLAVVVALKNEGAAWVGAHLLTAVLIARQIGASWRSCLEIALRAGIPAGVMWVGWWLVVSGADMPNRLLSVSSVDYISGRPSVVIAFMGEFFSWAPRVVMLTVVAVVTALLARGTPWRRVARVTTFWLGPLLVLSFVSVVFMIAPYDFRDYMKQSVYRVTWPLFASLAVGMLFAGRLRHES